MLRLLFFFQSLTVTVFCSLNSTIRAIKITARITLCVDSMYVGNKRRRGAAGCLPPVFLSVCVSPFPTWLPAGRQCDDGDHHDGLVPFTDDGLSGSRRFAWGKWALSATAAAAAAAAGCCLPSVRGGEGREGGGLPGSPPILPSSLSLIASPSLSPSSQLHTRSPQALIARQPALPLSPAARRTRPFTHSRSPVATAVGCIGQRAAGRCFLSSSKLGLALPEKPSVAAALEEEDGRRARAVERLGYLSVQVTAIRTE